MPIIEVTLVEGRTPEKKEALIRALTDAAEQAAARRAARHRRAKAKSKAERPRGASS